MESIKCYFKVGNITKHGKDGIQYNVTSSQDILQIINHFNKYPLLTQKRADFELFKIVIEMMSRKEHLTIEGLRKIVAIKASLNLGLPDKLKSAFLNTMPVTRPLVEVPKTFDPH